MVLYIEERCTRKVTEKYHFAATAEERASEVAAFPGLSFKRQVQGY